MPESKFLPFQDANGDGLNDVCDEVMSVTPPPCPSCIPNSFALVPNWRTRKTYEPFLNEKTCEYQITITTKYTSALSNLPEGSAETITEDEAEAAIKDIYDEYVETAIQALLDVYNKDDSEGSKDLIREVIETTDWLLGVRPKARLKLLYSVPYEQLNALPVADSDEEEEEDSGVIEVSYDAEEMKMLMLKLRKGLWLYARNLKVYRALDKANLLFLDDNSVFNLDQYGDYGFKGDSSKMGRMLPALDHYLNTKGFNIRNVGSWNSDNVPISRITFEFSSEYELKKLTMEPAGCRDGDPIVHTGKLTALKQSGSPWIDPTAIAYFAQLREMVDGLTARTPIPWKDFIIRHTYPPIYDTALAYEEEGSYDSESPTALSCVGEALLDQGFQLAEDVMDEAFGLGDAIAYKFHEYLCQSRIGDTDAMKEEMGIYLTTDPETGKTVINDENVMALAKEQAFKEIRDGDIMFSDFCLYLFGDTSEANKAMSAQEIWKDLRKKFDRIKLCGLLDLLAEAIQCLLGGLTLEEALGKMIMAALEAMSVDNFGDLFIGLPPDKQAEMEAMVKQKLESGDIFKDDSANASATDGIAGNYTEDTTEGVGEKPTTWYKPWDYPDKEEHDWKSSYDASYSEQSYGEWTDYQEQSTMLGNTTSGISGTAAAMDPNIVLQAYIGALIETYAGEEMELLDLLGDFPGAPIISYIIATLSCPFPSFFNPSIADFIKSLELPICRNMKEIAWPTLMIPPIEEIVDLWRLLLEAAKVALAMLIQKILMMLMVKLCEILGEFICKALEVVGDIAVAAVTGNSILDAIRESICGEDVEDAVLESTVTELFQSFGNGGAAFSDSEQVMQFTADISSSVTRTEAANAFLGDASTEFCTVVDNLIEFEYPEFRKAFKGPADITKAFGNMGNVMPLSFKKQLQDFVKDLGPEDQMPANPTLCATPAQLEEFNEVRCQLLEGRVSREQCDKLNADFKEQLSDDLEDLAGIMQGGLPAYIENNMPPLVSDPGCDNGILPYEPEEAASAVAGSLGSQLEMLKGAYADDMLGNGPRQRNWGLINMILSDTLACPITVHDRKTDNRRKRVNFYSDWNPNTDETPSFSPFMMIQIMKWLASQPADLEDQRGAYPYKVGEWLQAQLKELTTEYEVNNSNQGDDPQDIPFSDLPGSGLFGNQVNFMKLPDFGYNVEIEPDFDSEIVTFNRAPRKKTPDLTLEFRDNAMGLDNYAGNFSYGFDLQVYLADLVQNEDGVMVNRPEIFEDTEGNITYKPSDSTRIMINNIIKPGVDTGQGTAQLIADPQEKKDALLNRPDPGEEMETMAYEFMAIDDTFAYMTDLEEKYPTFAQSFTVGATDYSPPLILLEEILYNNANYGGGIVGVESTYKETLKELHESLSTLIAGTEGDEMAWLYGAEFDTLTVDDIEYVVKEGQTDSAAGTPYQDATIDGKRLLNRDMILGVSADQLANGDDARVTYLDPSTYGGNYMNPPLYIKPLKNNGWLGLIDVLFPELTACKPANTDLVDFGDIQDMIDDIYPTMPDDPRLFKDPDCVKEVPYDRILNRSSKAFLIGLIMAAIRIFCSVHIIKSMSVFSRFAPRFPQVFSAIYASYIVESMESTFKSVGGAFYERNFLFKSNKFWYRFLEQSVQAYAYRVDLEQIEPPPHVVAAMTRLVNMQQKYDYPDKEDLRDAKDVDEIPWFRRLKRYKMDENLEAILVTQEDAKIILKELVGEQLSVMSKTIVTNLKTLGMAPEIHDMDYYLLDNFVQDGSLKLNETVKVDGSFQASYIGLPVVPYEDEDSGVDAPYYTGGGQFVVGEDNDGTGATEGEEYIGYYHVYIDEETGDVVYMSGEYHDDAAHDRLLPLVTITQIPVGDVPDIGESTGTDKPFLVEKYIRITTPASDESGISGLSSQYTMEQAVELIKANDGLSLLSEIYPGSLALVYDDEGNPVGLEGELGVRYGLKFSLRVGSAYEEVTSIEMDALDLPVNQFSVISADSGILACLLKQLTRDETFRLVTHYVFPLRKMVSVMAIYTDMGLLPSIGQETVGEGESWPTFSLADLLGGETFDTSNKPGVTANVSSDGSTVSYSYKEGWTYKDDRPGWIATLRYKSWDEWDQVLLRNCKSRIKKLFKTHYNDRDFDFNEMGGRRVSQLKIKELRAAIKPPTGDSLLPWWKKKRLRSNPFNADGELCENED